MKFEVVNKSTTVNRFVLHTLQRNITHLAVITRKTKIKIGILKRGGLEKSLLYEPDFGIFSFPPFSLEHEFYGVKGEFTRFIMTTKYVCHNLISPYVNFHNKRKN